MTFSVNPQFLTTTALVAAVLPLLAFGVIMIGTRKRPFLSAGVSIGAMAISFGCALTLLIAGRHLAAPVSATATWLTSGAVTIPVGVYLDPLSLLMLMVVSTIALLVQIYSLGYMAGDPGFGRYYAFMSLFAWAMISLTLASSLFQIYVFWELVGLSSYFLIGFWFEKFSASTAGKKAFVMTRAGDVAFFLGLLLVLYHAGNLDIAHITAATIKTRMSPALLTVAILLIFGGIVGKSAQFPLMTWLPDAMEGPTPVSALLHSATMVAAGVYLFARLYPLFALSPTAMTVCLAIATISMLLASTMALVATDIKQVWAYSTISQLGFMIMALGAGGYAAGVFHLTTHAGFKALLFLCAGVFIHAFGTNDIITIGRHQGRRMLVPMICMVIGAAALSGLPPFSGFFSKEMIMAALATRHDPIWLAAGLTGGFLTAYYSFRLVFLILVPDEGIIAGEGEAEHGEHHGSRAMDGPLIVLAGVTLVLGFFKEPLIRFLHATGGAEHAAHMGWVSYAAMGAAFSGLILAWIEFGRAGAPRIGVAERLPAVRNLFAERWYIDRFYRRMLDTVIYAGISRTCENNDRKVIDGTLDGIGATTVGSGRILAWMHRGAIQTRLAVMFAVVAMLGLYCFLS